MSNIALAYRMDFDYSAGTLWWGKEEILQERFSLWHASESHSHPLLSGRNTPLRDYMSEIPMFVGTSNTDKGPVVVEGVSSSDKITSFGTMISAGDIYVSDIKEGNYCEDEEWTVWQNRHKPRLNAAEMLQFQKFQNRVRQLCGR